jgi:3-phenylpropionate/trans-cinnamate dioxygenase ferredoxin subunit
VLLASVNDVGEYVRIAETKDVSKNQMQVFNVKGREILLINVEGTFYAFENRCPPMGYPLFFGSLEGDTLICGFHSAKFNVRTGKSIGPATDVPLKTLPFKTQNSSIFIEV